MTTKKLYEIIEKIIYRIIYNKYYAFLHKFPSYAPNSAGNPKTRVNILCAAINKTFPSLLTLIQSQTKKDLPININDISYFAQFLTGNNNNLGRLFTFYGSDKATGHNYDIFYSYLLANPNEITSILEIGIGTNNLDVLSNMGKYGRPGASLRAFRDYCPNAEIYGADIDSRILFTENRIQTYVVDQTSTESLKGLSESLNFEFDLIIDDGLHVISANINSLNFGLKKLKVLGWLVVEDIPLDSLDMWKVIASILSENFSARIINTKNNVLIFAAQRLS